MALLDYCPFCGCVEVALIKRQHDQGVFSQIECTHCGARGGSFIEETDNEAFESARNDWNQSSLRPNTLCDRVRRKLTQLEYDLHEFLYKIKHWDF